MAGSAVGRAPRVPPRSVVKAFIRLRRSGMEVELGGKTYRGLMAEILIFYIRTRGRLRGDGLFPGVGLVEVYELTREEADEIVAAAERDYKEETGFPD